METGKGGSDRPGPPFFVEPVAAGVTVRLITGKPAVGRIVLRLPPRVVLGMSRFLIPFPHGKRYGRGTKTV